MMLTQRTLFSWCSPFSLSAPPSNGFLNPEGMAFIDISHLGLSVQGLSFSALCLAVSSQIWFSDRAEQDTDLGVQQNVIRSPFIATLCFQCSSIYFYPSPYQQSSLRFLVTQAVSDSELFSFHELISFLFLVISNFNQQYLDKMHRVISVFLQMLKLPLYLSIWSILEKYHELMRKYILLCLNKMFFSYLLGPFGL